MDKDFLYNQLIRLGDMMGDSLHHESDGKWIIEEYKQILKALNIKPKQKYKKRIDKEVINKAIEERLKNFKCPKCSGELKQTKSGSMRAKCINCKALYQVLKRRK